MRKPPNTRTQTGSRSSGFTLVEMMVATALVVLIMLMFAQIYGDVFGSISNQRALANNDQKARQFDVIIREDLQSLTYRQPTYPYADVRGIVPLAPGDELIIDPVNQRGYLYYSENNPLDQTDDVLQFTTLIKFGERGDQEFKKQRRGYVGRAANLGANIDDQPEHDDGYANNGEGISRAAEVVYFMRNGNLYRRHFLLRDPLQSGTPATAQPSTQTGIDVYSRTNQNYGGANGFYSDFDYAATRMYLADINNVAPPRPSYLWFHSVDSLSNHRAYANNPIALPWNRYGFLNVPYDYSGGAPDPNYHHGNPREYVDDDPAGTPYGFPFMGRFTQEETSNVNFGWPGTDQGNSLVRFDRAANGTLTNGANGTVVGLDTGSRPRIGEDIILTNVESFDVELLDHIFGAYVNIGEPDGPDVDNFQETELFADGDRNQVIYGPRMPQIQDPPTSQNRVFDTWHPGAQVLNPPPLVTNNSYTFYARLPPLRPLKTDVRVTTGNQQVQRTGFVWRAGVNTAGVPTGVIVDPTTQVYFPLAGEDQQLRLLDDDTTNDNIDTVNFPLDAFADRNGNGVFDYPGALPNTSLVAVPIGVVDPDPNIGYRPGTTFPEWPLTPGATVIDGNIIWQIQDNRIGVRSMRITVRFRDQRSQTPRQATFVHSFVE